MANPRYHFIARDWASGAIAGTLPFSKFGFAETLNAAGTWSAEMDPYDPTAALLVPHRTFIYALRSDNTIAFAGMLGALDWSAQGEEGIDTLAASGYSLWGYFWRRLTSSQADHVFHQVEQLAIAKRLLDDAQAFFAPIGSIGVTTVLNPPAGSGQLRDRSYLITDGTILGEVIEQLADVDNGFEFRVTAAWSAPATGARPTILHTCELWYPRLGIDQPFIWRDGTAIRVTDYSVDSYAYATQVLATGAVAGNGVNPPAYDIEWAYAAGEPIYEAAISAPDVLDAATLTAKAAQGILTSEQQLLRVEIVDESNWPYGTWSIGDTIRLISDRGTLDLDGNTYWRITGMSVDVDDIGAVTTSVDFTDSLRRSKPVTRAAKTLARQHAAQASAIAALQRHP